MKARLLDLFCGAGGAAMGYHRAGFEVVGVDITPQPNYPFPFVQGDALNPPVRLGDFDAIHASPPCQAWSTMGNRYRGRGGPEHEKLIAPTRDLCQASGLPFVIENVVGARWELVNPITVSGGQFGLHVHRPRLFESNVLLLQLPTAGRGDRSIGVYGDRPDGRRLNTRLDGYAQRAASSLSEAQEAMGIDWMEWSELKEAIPPAYTEFIGQQLLEHMRRAA